MFLFFIFHKRLLVRGVTVPPAQTPEPPGEDQAARAAGRALGLGALVSDRWGAGGCGAVAAGSQSALAFGLPLGPRVVPWGREHRLGRLGHLLLEPKQRPEAGCDKVETLFLTRCVRRR